MLEVKGLVAGYAGSEVLHGIDLVVNDREGVIVLGPNGHGKTTLLRAITGLLPRYKLPFIANFISSLAMVASALKSMVE